MIFNKIIPINENTSVNYIIKTLLEILNRWSTKQIILKIEVYENDKKKTKQNRKK